jgi:hypothetical protein
MDGKLILDGLLDFRSGVCPLTHPVISRFLIEQRSRHWHSLASRAASAAVATPAPTVSSETIAIHL